MFLIYRNILPHYHFDNSLLKAKNISLDSQNTGSFQPVSVFLLKLGKIFKKGIDFIGKTSYNG